MSASQISFAFRKAGSGACRRFGRVAIGHPRASPFVSSGAHFFTTCTSTPVFSNGRAFGYLANFCARKPSEALRFLCTNSTAITQGLLRGRSVPNLKALGGRKGDVLYIAGMEAEQSVPGSLRVEPGGVRGVPMWRMGEYGPAQMMIPFPSGQGTDGEIDRWLAQTRAVARMHHGPVPSYAHPDAPGGFDGQRRLAPTPRPMLRAELCDDMASGRGPGRSRPGPERAVRELSSGPSSLQSLREVVSTSTPVAQGSSGTRGPALRGKDIQPRASPDRLAFAEARGSFTAAGRQIRPRQLDAYPRDKVERSPAGAPPNLAARSAGVEGKAKRALSPSPKTRKTTKSPKKVAASAPSGKVQALTVKPAAEYADISIFPRRKAGQSGIGNNRPPVVITRDVLEQHFNMPLLSVCKKLVCGRGVSHASPVFSSVLPLRQPPPCSLWFCADLRRDPDAVHSPRVCAQQC